MTQALIRAGFETTLKTWADAQTPAIPVAWENVPFTPPVGRYVRAILLPAPNHYLTLDGVGRRWRGIFQVSFCMPLGTGAGTAESLAASLDAAFAQTFTYSTMRLYLLEPMSAAPPLDEPDRFVVPVSAQYEAYATL